MSASETGRRDGPPNYLRGISDQPPYDLYPGFAKEMSATEKHMKTLEWRRLHLAKAKLKATVGTSALLSGFAVTSMVELQMDSDNTVPPPLLIACAVCTTLLVSVHLLALMIATCILPHVDAVASLHGMVPVSESPHRRLHRFIEIAWMLSTVFGIFLFLIEIGILCLVRFWDYSDKGKVAGVSSVILLMPICLIFTAFAVYFYRSLITHKYKVSSVKFEELETMVSRYNSQVSVLGVDNNPAVIQV